MSNDAPVIVTIASSVDDMDVSEDLTVTFEVPELVSQPGVLLGELDADLTASGEPAGTFTFVDNDVTGVYELAVDLTTPGNEDLTATEQADLINDLLNAGGITFVPADDFSGIDPSDPDTFDVIVTSTERATGTEVETQFLNATGTIAVFILPSTAAPSSSPSAFGDSVAPTSEPSNACLLYTSPSPRD